MKSSFIHILQLFARLILRKYRPTVVAITGSVGKTSTKEAVYAVLSSKFSVRASPKNYNNELGVPLAIAGARAPGRSPLKWCAAFWRALGLVVWPVRFPAILALEMAADRPGDIGKLVKLAPPKVGVVTAVAPVHTEFFKSVEGVAREKRRLVEAVPKDGTVVLNMDDEIVREFGEHAKGAVVEYGIMRQAAVRAVEVQEYIEIGDWISEASEIQSPYIARELGGVRFKILHNGSVVPAHLPNVLGMSQVYAALAAAAVGRAFGMNMVEISKALLRYSPPPGRMRLITGVKGTILIDDTYNASPRAAMAALETLGKLTLPAGAKRYGVLADMLELGTLTEISHREVGRAAASNADVLIGVGVSAQWMADEAVKAGMSRDRVLHFHNLEEGVEHFLQERIKPGDVVLIKGSQSMRLERLVKALMAEPQRANEFLCRQGKEWRT